MVGGWPFCQQLAGGLPLAKLRNLSYSTPTADLSMEILDWILHLDKHLESVITYMGPWFYALVTAIIFGETGLVIAPFLPGDSLLFAVGAFAAKPEFNLNIWYFLPLLIVAAIVAMP